MELDTREWLEADGLGGFASGTVSGLRTRRYHALVLVAMTPPTGRLVLANGFDAWLETDQGIRHLTTQHYGPDVRHPDGASRLKAFAHEPWPTWRWRITDEVDLVQELFVARGSPRTVLRFRLTGPLGPAQLKVRPFLSGRDYHSTHHENASFSFASRHPAPGVVEWSTYDGLPGVRSYANASYEASPEWYRNFLYLHERDRGLDCQEDLASPGVLTFDLAAGDAHWMLEPTSTPPLEEPVTEAAGRLRRHELARREARRSRLDRAADQYLVRRGDGCTVIAGYPWFTDWGRDTFIAIRGLCLATGRLSTARRILLSWAGAVSGGMLPNRFPDGGDVPEFNSVDASLWFVVAVRDLLCAAKGRRGLTEPNRRQLIDAVEAIVDGYARGTRFGIHADDDGLIAAGGPGTQLTWMDAKIGDEVVTPRVGKPVEVQALWLNALEFAGRYNNAWRSRFERALQSFQARFWNDQRGCLYDVIDVDHVAGRVDGSLRPNQIFAIGGLPRPILTGARARRVVDLVEETLLTPMGLRSLAPGEDGYTGRYEGPPSQRDRAYHQGTVWPYLMGPFAEAWARVRGNTAEARAEARERFLRPLLDSRDRAGLGHLPEIADGDAPHTARGCLFQAWSLGEVLRVMNGNLLDADAS